MANIYETLDEHSVQTVLLPKMKLVFQSKPDLKVTTNLLYCIEMLMCKFEKIQVSNQSLVECSRGLDTIGVLLSFQITDDVMPILLEVNMSDPDIIVRVVREYRHKYTKYNNNKNDAIQILTVIALSDTHDAATQSHLLASRQPVPITIIVNDEFYAQSHLAHGPRRRRVVGALALPVTT